MSIADEYNSYWALHDINKAEQSLSTLFNYLALYPPYNDPYYVLQATNLVGLYAFENNMTYQNVNISYSDLIAWYEGYLNKFIQDIQDTQNKVNALLAYNSFLTAIGNTLGSFFNSIKDFITNTLGMPVWLFLIILGAVGFIIFRFLK